MSFEAEVIPLFIGGVIVVSILELILGCLYLKEQKRARSLLIGHVVSMALAFAFLVRSIFANWLQVEFEIASISNSVNIGLFGLLWMISVLCVLAMIRECIKK